VLLFGELQRVLRPRLFGRRKREGQGTFALAGRVKMVRQIENARRRFTLQVERGPAMQFANFRFRHSMKQRLAQLVMNENATAVRSFSTNEVPMSPLINRRDRLCRRLVRRLGRGEEVELLAQDRPDGEQFQRWRRQELDAAREKRRRMA